MATVNIGNSTLSTTVNDSINAIFTSSSTYGVNVEQSMYGIESFNINVHAWQDGAQVDVKIRTSEVPRSPEELVKIIANDYLKAKGINKTLDEIIEEFLPEFLL